GGPFGGVGTGSGALGVGFGVGLVTGDEEGPCRVAGLGVTTSWPVGCEGAGAATAACGWPAAEAVRGGAAIRTIGRRGSGAGKITRVNDAGAVESGAWVPPRPIGSAGEPPSPAGQRLKPSS